MEAATTGIAEGVAGETVGVVTGNMTEIGDLEAEEAGIGRAEAGGETGITTSRGRALASVPPRMSSSKLLRMWRESGRGNLTWSFQVSEFVGRSVPQMREGYLIFVAALMVKPKGDATTPIKNGLDNPDVANVVLKQRDDAKRSESPAVSKVGPRRDSIR